ncbi:MAG TPA: hypothetical protein V6D17_22815 [Candidatus Obscuribacterales bacterium]
MFHDGAYETAKQLEFRTPEENGEQDGSGNQNTPNWEEVFSSAANQFDASRWRQLLPKIYSRYGVQASLINPGGNPHLSLFIRAEGEDKRLLIVDQNISEESLHERLDNVLNKKIEEMSKKYAVTFTSDNDAIRLDQKENPIRCRRPRLDELFAFESALEESFPSHLSDDGTKGTRVFFLRERLFEKGGAMFIYNTRAGQPGLLIDSILGERRLPLTEEDTNNPEAVTLEFVLLHELTHNGQRKLGWEKAENTDKFSRELGWLPVERSVDGKSETTWLMETKDGRLLSFSRTLNQWIVCNRKGEPTDDKGLVTTENSAQRLTGAQARTLAKITPPTLYFSNPREMDAEVTTTFRVSKGDRARLLRDYPTLYQRAKANDQLEINLVYGLDGNGLPKLIRDPDGRLVERTDKNMHKIDDFERKANKK